MKKLLIIVLGTMSINAKAQICFTTTNYMAGSLYTNSTAIASADFNNDGILDLIAANYIFSDQYLLLGDGLGGFGSPSPVELDSAIKSMVSADFNNDGNADIALASYPGLVKILFGDGTGNFPATNSFSIGDYPFSICSADFNEDGKIDLATANGSNPGVSVLLGDGMGSFFSIVDFFTGDGAVAITNGDFNGDNKTDLAITNDGNGGGIDSLAVMLGDGTGNFGTAIKYVADASPHSVCSSDFNNDGFADIAVANTNSNNISVFFSQGASGLFNPAINYATGSEPFSIVSSDFNSDGNPDLATANHGGNSVSILLGNTTGSFGAVSNFSAYSGLWSIISSDFNSDGKPDLATANHDGNLISVLLNIVSTNCIGCALNSSVAIPDICMVSTDSASNYNYNVVYWDKTLYTDADSFIVYRKDAISSNYLRIGAVSKDSLSEFIDTCFTIGGPNGGNPQYSSWLYKLAIRDTCGNIGDKSPYHQSMFVQQSGSNFSWNAYTVEIGQTNPVTGYSFLRDDNNTGNWHILVNTISTSTTDPDFTNFPNGNWRIDALGFNCMPTRTQNAYSKSHSNVTNLLSTGIFQLSNFNASVFFYPNPATNTLMVTNIAFKITIRLYNTLGKLVMKQETDSNIILDISYLPKGVYFMEVQQGASHNEKTFNKKIKKIVLQ